MTHVRRNTILGTVLVVTLVALFSAGGEAIDRPIVDTKQSGPCSFIDSEAIRQLPASGRQIAGLAEVLPQEGTVDTQKDSKGNVRGAVYRVGDRTLQFRTQVKKVDCSFEGQLKGVDLWGGYRGDLRLSWHTQPEDRMYLRATNLRLNGGPIRGEQLWFFKPMGTQVADQPPPEDIPVVPGPPVDPAPSTGFPIYVGGPFLLNGARGSGKVWADPHTNCEGHTVIKDGVTYRLCTAGEGETSLTAFNVTPKRFDMRKTSPPRMGWEWSPFSCEPAPNGTVGCTAKGKYLGYDILGTISNLQVTPGTLNFGANLNVRLLSTQGDVGFRAAGQLESLGF